MGLFGGSRKRQRQSRRGGKTPSKTPSKTKGKTKGKGTKWTRFVQKIFQELKQKNPDVKLKDAMKAASKRKSEMSP
jgi:hypothetical protein